MEIQIIPQQCGGTEFYAVPHRLHLGAQNAEGVDQLHFVLPEAWAGCTLALYLRRRDGTQLAPIPLDSAGCVTVDRRLTGSTSGQWMLAAVKGSDYTAYTRPGSYDVYATLPTDGGSEDLPPSLYEQFVARVLESAQSAAESARKAQEGAADTTVQAALAQSAADKVLADRTNAADCAARAEAAAKRAENIAAAGGQVLSVNGKGGVVQLTAQDVGAVSCPALPQAGEVLCILSVDTATGAVQTDTTALPDLSPYLRSDAVPTAKAAGPVRADSQYGVAVRADATLTTVPATRAQLDSMTHGYAPLTPAVLPYGVKKALTSAASAADWSAQEKAAALLQLGADSLFYSKAEADRKFGAPYTLPAATASTLGGIKVGKNLSVSADGTLTGPAPYALTAEKIAAALGFTPATLPYTLTYDHSYTGTGEKGSAAAPLVIQLAQEYDAVAVITTATGTYAVGSELARQRMLLELVTHENSKEGFAGNYVALKTLPTAFTSADKVGGALNVFNGTWNYPNTYLRRNGKALECYCTINAAYVWNTASNQYHVFGITLPSSILPTAQ